MKFSRMIQLGAKLAAAPTAVLALLRFLTGCSVPEPLLSCDYPKSKDPIPVDTVQYEGRSVLYTMDTCMHYGPETGAIYDREWEKMIRRHEEILQNPHNAAEYKKWLSLLDPYKDASIFDRAKAVDGLVDEHIFYVSDKDNYDKQEYWATPMEILSRGSGDCEDFVILKCFSLQYLGVPLENFALARANIDGDQNRGHGIILLDTAQMNPNLQSKNTFILDSDHTIDGAVEPIQKTGYKSLKFLFMRTLNGDSAGKNISAKDTLIAAAHYAR